MRKIKYLVMLMFLFPVMPDLSCVSVYASEGVQAESIDNHLAAILFFLCVLVGNRLWKVFISSFEKGTF
ncbi:MAG: hypothetical protein FWD31_04375 [Planctomycetaceae bacterium]|nr:hypothetical protein [Planctomycetaceae bacterium]